MDFTILRYKVSRSTLVLVVQGTPVNQFTPFMREIHGPVLDSILKSRTAARKMLAGRLVFTLATASWGL